MRLNVSLVGNAKNLNLFKFLGFYYYKKVIIMISQSDYYYSHLNASALARLKRLKIQESVLCTSINKSVITLEQEHECLSEIQTLDDFKRYESPLFDLFSEIKNLFEDIKINTNPHNDINELDIDEVKRDIFHLESKLRTFKSHLQTELRSLVLDAKNIHKELSTIPAPQPMVNHKLAKASAKAFIDIVPSPVRVLINCPFKCPEVQSLQEFLKSSRVRSKGWNEYNHNVFVQVWNKHFSSKKAVDKLNQDNSVENIERLHRFQEEVMEKIPGLTLEDTKSYYTWYTEFVYLKTRQQKALEKWKENKQKMKKRDNKAKQKSQSWSSNSSANNSNSKLLHNRSEDTLQSGGNPLLNSRSLHERTKSAANFNKTKSNDSNGALHLSGILKRTEQWRQNSVDQWKPPLLFSRTENKRQLRIPSWRLGLY